MRKIFKFYTQDLALRASVAISTEVVQEICEMQDAYPCASMALGRLLTGAALMASQLGEKQSLCIRMEGDGPLEELYAEASFEGIVRAYCRNPHADPPHLADGHLDIPTAIGKGTLSVTRNLPFQKQPHMGIVPIVSGEVSQDLAFYLQQSHQIPSVVSLAVSLDKEGEVTVAGGVLIEVIPGAKESTVKKLEELAQSAPALSQELLKELEPIEILRPYVHNSKIIAIDHAHELRYECRCSMERVERTLTLLGKATLAEMALKGETVQVRCEFCAKNFQVPIDQIRKLLQQVS